MRENEKSTWKWCKVRGWYLNEIWKTDICKVKKIHSCKNRLKAFLSACYFPIPYNWYFFLIFVFFPFLFHNDSFKSTADKILMLQKWARILAGNILKNVEIFFSLTQFVQKQQCTGMFANAENYKYVFIL